MVHYLTPRHHRETVCRGQQQKREISKNKASCPMVSKQDLPFHPYRRRGLEPDTRYSSVSLRLGTETSLDKTITRPALAPGRALRRVGDVFLWSQLIFGQASLHSRGVGNSGNSEFSQRKRTLNGLRLSFPKCSFLTLSQRAVYVINMIINTTNSTTMLKIQDNLDYLPFSELSLGIFISFVLTCSLQVHNIIYF